MELEFREIRPRKVVNVHRHVDGPWFWTKYSAHPYVGCHTGCTFCYFRAGHYLGRRPAESFDRLIEVKTHAAELLAAELSRLPPDVISCGDWQQPAERRFRLSRRMLAVVRDAGFPLLVVERAPQILDDLDLLVEIHRRSRATVLISLSNVDPDLKRAFEPRSPGVRQRLEAMAALAAAGLPVGASLMPILPFLGDDPRRLEDAVLAIRDHGGSWVIAAGMTMGGAQAELSLAAARQVDPGAEAAWRRLYAWEEGGRPTNSPPRETSARLGRQVRELCRRHGLDDRLPRYILPGPRAINQRIAELLFLRTYELELELAPSTRVWAYRKAAWTIDELGRSLVEIAAEGGEAGLTALPGIGSRLAGQIARWLRAERAWPVAGPA